MTATYKRNASWPWHSTIPCPPPYHNERIAGPRPQPPIDDEADVRDMRRRMRLDER